MPNYREPLWLTLPDDADEDGRRTGQLPEGERAPGTIALRITDDATAAVVLEESRWPVLDDGVLELPLEGLAPGRYRVEVGNVLVRSMMLLPLARPR